MARRSPAQRIGDLGEALVRAEVEGAGGWIARTQEKDYGIDLELELDTPQVAGHFLKVQVRTSKNQSASRRVKKDELRYAAECRVPVLLVAADLSSPGESHYLWLQEWLDKPVGRAALAGTASNITIAIPRHQLLTDGLRGRLRDVARHRTPVQLWFGVRDALRSAAAVRQADVAEALAELLAAAQRSGAVVIDDLVEEIVSLGTTVRFTEEGNRVMSVLWGLCRKLGAQFSREQVDRLVTRGDGASRAGITALGLLYDNHFEAMKALDLPSHYTGRNRYLAYYATLRERHPDRTGPGVILGAQPADFAVAGFHLHPGVALGDLLNKWANRGDSAILDFLVSDGEPIAPIDDE